MAFEPATIRQLLTAAFNNEDLVTLCFDHFHTIYYDIETMPFSQKARHLVDYCQRYGLTERLLGIVRQLNPTQYEKFIGATTQFSSRAHYLAQVAAYHKTLEFVGIPELKDRQAMNIEDIFIHLQAEVESHTPLSGRQLPMLTLEAEKSEPIRRQVSVNDALRQHRQLVVLGDPGAGKTTLLKYIILSFARSEGARLGLDEERLPIFIRLYDYVARRTERQEDYSLIDYLYTQARENLMLALEPGFFETELAAGNCILCLDGMDELGRAGVRRDVAAAIAALAHRYPLNRFIISSRIVGYNEAPLDDRAFIHHRVLPFRGYDIEQFITKWYRAREHDPVRAQVQANQLTRTIMAEARIKALAKNPLLLTIITLIHRIEAELPHERVKLYEKCVTALVETWEQVKRLTVADRERPYFEHRYHLLEQLAYWLHIQPSEGNGRPRQVAEGDLTVQLSQFLLKDPFLQLDRRTAWDEAAAFIELIKARTGLLVERGEDIYTFAHLTFQEYLTAAYLMHEHAHSIDELWAAIAPRLHDPHWREVILLLLGSLSKFRRHPTALIDRILAQEDVYEPVLHRNLYLAANALADRVMVDARLRNRVIDNLLALMQSDELGHEDVITALGTLVGNDYLNSTLLTLANNDQLPVLVRRDAARVLGKLGLAGKAVDILRRLLQNDAATAADRQAAGIALAELGYTDEAAAALLALAQDSSKTISGRSTAALSLGQLGNTDDQVISGLLTLARDEVVDAEVRSAAMVALGELGYAETAVLSTLLEFVCDDTTDDWLRSASAAALVEIGETDETMLDRLLVVACDVSVAASVRRDTAAALGELGRPEAVVPVLKELTRKGKVSATIRLDAATALGQFEQEDAAEEALLALILDDAASIETRLDAAEAMGQMGFVANDTLAGMMALLQDATAVAEVRGAVATAVATLGHTDKPAQVLLTLVHQPALSERARCEFAITLGLLGYVSEAVAVLHHLAHDKTIQPFVRETTAYTLGQFGYPDEAKTLILDIIQDTNAPLWVRRTAYNDLKALLG
ncbi:MAG: NACHT domain-containing protein [Anaerolineales bacterium]|nr:NACHT domain-containing protein [Anaerolineales bacterium]